MSARQPIADAQAIVRAAGTVELPIEFARDEGRTAYDVIGTTHAALLLLSERFRGVLQHHGFSGWTSYQASVEFDGSELDGYAVLAVTGRCGPIDDALSKEVILPPPVPNGQPRRALRGLCFSPQSWDGSDFFMSDDGGAQIFVVERVKDAVEKAGLRNVAFERLSEIDRIWRADGTLIERPNGAPSSRFRNTRC